jgi:undecaprenyl-diphosphatase
VSRSGSTISAALSAGLKRDAAARFSFLIAVPAIGGASVLLVKDLVEQGGSSHSALNLIAGGIVSFIVGLAALRVLIRVVVQGKLHWFAYYCLVLGTLVIAYELLVGTSRSP